MGRPNRTDAAFGERLREAMDRAHVRPAALAKVEGVLPSSVSRWRRGEVPDDLRLPGLARRLGVGLKWLKTGQGRPEDTDPAPDAPGDATRLQGLLARLDFLRDQLKAYRDLQRPVGPEILAEWLEVIADIEEAKLPR